MIITIGLIDKFAINSTTIIIGSTCFVIKETTAASASIGRKLKRGVKWGDESPRNGNFSISLTWMDMAAQLKSHYRLSWDSMVHLRMSLLDHRNHHHSNPVPTAAVPTEIFPSRAIYVYHFFDSNYSNPRHRQLRWR